ncbi:MAG: ABC transporter permease [Betaproteobacteria bacterium]|jgi:putative spermidine/putrescine transport system permease protein|nr:ABC transporter permease [Betaproteobacteria bacterium]
MDRSESIRWGQLLALPLLVSGLLLLGSQFVFLKQSIYIDLPFGKIASDWSFANFRRIATDPFYLRTLWLTTWISAAVAGLCVILGFPIAKTLARLQSRWATLLLSLIVLTSFITTVIQIFGLLILFRGDGLINQMLMGLGLIQQPFTLIGTSAGVVLGLVYASFGFSVMLMYGIVRTIPVSLEEAAAIHGASRLRVFRKVLLPLCLPGLVVGFLTIFNTSMGAFTSAALLGGGRVITLPVLIQRTMLLDVKYGMAAALAALLLAFVVILNLASVMVLRRLRHAQGVMA